MVDRAIRAYQLRSRHDRLRDAGLLTLTEMATTLGVAKSTVKAWYHAGIVTGQRYNDKGEVLYDPPGPNPPTPHYGRPRLADRRPAQTPPTPDQPEELQYANLRFAGRDPQVRANRR